MNMFRNLAVAALAAATILTATAAAQETTRGVQAKITLKSGDVVTGRLLSETADLIIVDHPTLGSLSIPRDQVADFSQTPISQTQAEEISAAAASAEQAEADREAADKAAAEAEAKRKDPWSGEISLGLSGSTGNTELVNIRFGASATRETEDTLLNLSATYKFTKDEGETTDDRFFAKGQNDWFFKDSRWTWFLRGEFEIDEFKDYDWRASLYTGPGYRFIDNDTTRLIGRAGAGGSYEEGGVRDGFIPEAFAGVDFSHKFNERVSLTASADIFPNLDDFGEFRSRENAALNFIMTDNGAWVLRIGAEHRYDSDTDEAEKNELDYFAQLVYSF
ncbi:MAG: DUF481 domain-containing protein [Planctomycetota bacterium]|nr:DUF481 domain-containing protein [Planctomycetota bacterium]